MSNGDDLPGGRYIVPFSQAVRFHGHICPGLAVGYYAAHLGMRWIADHASPDDEAVAVLEFEGCGADAVQAITGCTTGKGNLVLQDHGKQVYTFGIRGRKEAVRIALRPEYTVDKLDPELLELNRKVYLKQANSDELRELQRRIERVCRAILESPGESVFEVKETTIKAPERDGMPATVTCAKCGEPVAAAKAKKAGDGYLCPPCARK